MQYTHSFRKALVLFAAIFILGVGLTACSYLENAKQSDAFKKFCDWAPVAVAGIDQAAIEAAKDPVKVRVGEAMKEASGYLKLVAAQCMAPVIAVK